MPPAAPIWVPPESQVFGESTLQRKNFSVPDHGVIPDTVRFAESVTCTEPPVPMEVGGALVPSAAFGVVVNDELPTRLVSLLSPQLPAAGFVFGESPV